MNLIDLRSDTMTRPTPAMRAAMAVAEVGDDQFGEDPTVNRLQERTAELLGKEAALWFPTGTMANQVALRLLTRPGDHVIVSQGSHAFWFETGGSGANAGVQLSEAGERGLFTAEDVLALLKPRNHQFYPPTTLVEIENTHNRAGGIVFPALEAERICGVARDHDLATYLDGARLWNAAVASGSTVADLSRPFTLVSVALSKGLGAPGGSLLAGSRELMTRAVRFRRMAGGAMRQVGIFAAAGLHALDHHLDRLADDHVHARDMAEIFLRSTGILLDPRSVQTNIVVFDTKPPAPEAPLVVLRAKERGVLLYALSARTLRVVTHLDVSGEDCHRAAQILVDIVERGE
jgi:threonine aldolase